VGKLRELTYAEPLLIPYMETKIREMEESRTRWLTEER
jgi:hypothetical protein